MNIQATIIAYQEHVVNSKNHSTRSTASNQLELTVERLTGTVIWHVRGGVSPTSVSAGATMFSRAADRAAFDAAAEGWFVDVDSVLWVKTASAGSRTVTVQR